jgi:hypothetical protein
MGASRLGFSGSCPFGNAAYIGTFCESSRSGDDAQPAKINITKMLVKTVIVVRIMPNPPR